MKKNHRIYAVVTLIAIIFYGILKILVCRLYSVPVGFILTLFGFDPIHVLSQLNDFSPGETFKDYYLGWFFYYPTYLVLHLVFMHLLFFNQKRLKKQISLGLVIVVGALLILIFMGKWFGFMFIYSTSYALFQHLFGLPFILLSIEGGRILYNDIERKINSWTIIS